MCLSIIMFFYMKLSWKVDKWLWKYKQSKYLVTNFWLALFFALTLSQDRSFEKNKWNFLDENLKSINFNINNWNVASNEVCVVNDSLTAKFYFTQWLYNQALKLYLEKEKKDILSWNKDSLWSTYSDLWLLYLYWNKADKSLEYYNKAIDIADKISLTSKVSNLNDIALVYKSLNDVAKRTESLHNAIKIIDDNKELASSDPKFQSISFLVYTNACDLYLSYYNDKKEAKKYFDLLKSIAEETNYTEYQIYVLSWEPDFLENDINYEKTLDYYNKWLELSKEINSIEDIFYFSWVIKDTYSKLYSEKKDPKYLENQLMYREIEDSIYHVKINIDAERQRVAQEVINETEKKVEKIKAQEKENTYMKIIWSVAFALIISLWLRLKDVRERKKIEEQKNEELLEKNQIITQQKSELQQSNEEIRAINDELVEKNEIITEQKNVAEDQKKIVEMQKAKLDKAYQELESKTNNIEDSIKYAKKIQNLMIDNTNVFSTIFTNAFALSKPKDILGWDFYYAQKKNNFDVLVLGDCTWHGVPGAMLTIFGVEKTDESLKNAQSPLDVVEDLHKIFTRLHLPFYADMTVEIDNVVKNMNTLYDLYPELKNSVSVLNRLIDGLDDYKTFDEFIKKFPPKLEKIISTMKSIAPDDQCLSENINRIVVAAKTIFDKNPLEFSLLYEKTSTLSHDSMEVAVCFFEKNAVSKNISDQKYTKLHYSGAGRPVWILRDGEIQVYQSRKWDLWSMKYKRNDWIPEVVVDLKKGDLVYVFSDGVVDQFGWPDDKKIGQQRLKDFLLTIEDYPINQQQEKVQKFIESWIKHSSSATKQTDDILFIGVKV